MASRNFVRKVIDWIIFIYLLPLKISARLGLYVKGKILTYDEHYLVALDVIERNFSAHGGVVVDIGAFNGDSAIFFAKRLKHNLILGFEPNPDPYEQGKKNVIHFSNIKLHNLGFSNRTGQAQLCVTKNLVSSSLYDIKDLTDTSLEKVIEVKVDTLDNFFASLSDILLLKLDVQGAELDILTKGKETLKKTRLVLVEMLITEIYHGSCAYHEVDFFLRTNNFRIHTIISNYNNEGTKYFDALYVNLSDIK